MNNFILSLCLQDDYGQVEAMARDKQKEIESLSDELVELRSQAASNAKVANS